MRRVKSDVSHRIRRQPSIFTVRWFRIALGAGVALVLALLVGPWMSTWFRGDLPKSTFLLVPGGSKTAESSAPDTTSSRPGQPSSAPTSSSSAPARGTAGATGKTPAAAPESTPGTATRVTPGSASAATTSSTPPGTASAAPSTAAPSTATPPTVTAPSASPPAPRETAKAAPALTDSATPRAGSLASPPSVYWVQVGAFLDHKNADRLAERLKGDGLAAATTSFEQSRVLYRVLLASSDGGRVSDDTVERVKGLGHPVEPTADGPALTGLVPLRKAVETSHALRQQGVPVRLKQEVSSSTFRVVRVGSFSTVAEADATLAALTAKGVEGVVVRER